MGTPDSAGLPVDGKKAGGSQGEVLGAGLVDGAGEVGAVGLLGRRPGRDPDPDRGPGLTPDPNHGSRPGSSALPRRMPSWRSACRCRYPDVAAMPQPAPTPPPKNTTAIPAAMSQVATRRRGLIQRVRGGRATGAKASLDDMGGMPGPVGPGGIADPPHPTAPWGMGGTCCPGGTCPSGIGPGGIPGHTDPGGMTGPGGTGPAVPPRGSPELAAPAPGGSVPCAVVPCAAVS